MAVNKHHNFGYSGALPEAVGDYYYAQDAVRDFWFQQDAVGLLLKDLAATVPVLVSGGLVTQGTGDTLNITTGVGYAKLAVEIPNSWSSLPPTKTSVDLGAIRIAWTQQTNLVIASATLDGVTTNYVKVSYAESNLSSRARVKKPGSYYSEKVPSFTVTVSSAAPTDYQVVLATFVGSTGGTFTINSRAAIPVPSGSSDARKLAGENLSMGNPVGLCGGRWFRAMWALRATNSWYTGSGTHNGTAMCCDGSNRVFIVTEHATTAQVVAYYMTINADGTTTTIASDATIVNQYPLNICRIAPNKFLMVARDTGTATTLRFTVFSVSGSTITVGAAVTRTDAVGTCGPPGLSIGNANNEFVCCYSSTAGGAALHCVAGTVSVTTITLGTSVSMSSSVGSSGGQGWDTIPSFNINGTVWYGLLFIDNSGAMRSGFFKHSGTTVTMSTASRQGTTTGLSGTFTLQRISMVPTSARGFWCLFTAATGTPLMKQIMVVEVAGDSNTAGDDAEIVSCTSRDVWEGANSDGQGIYPMARDKIAVAGFPTSGGNYIYVGMLGLDRVPYLLDTFRGATGETVTLGINVMASLSGTRVLVDRYNASNVHKLMVFDFPEMTGVALETITAGNVVKVAVSGIVPVAGLVEGSSYGVNYYTGGLEENGKPARLLAIMDNAGRLL